MKTFNLTAPGRRGIYLLLTIAILGLPSLKTSAQLPDCVSGTVMYGVFGDSLGSAAGPVLTLDSTEIRPINMLTGAVGNLMGNKRWWVRKRVGTSSTYYYGASAMAVDFATSRFYLMTQMSSGSGLAKDIVTIDPVALSQTIIATTPSSLDDYHFVKMAAHPNNGWVYAIGVHRDSTAAASTFNPLVRISTCGMTPTANCATVQVLGYLPSTGNMYKWELFNGDLAFDSYGNLLFATAAFNYISGAMRYSNARLFKIDAANLPTAAGTGTIPMSLLADYDGLDSTVINGICLDPSGNMFLSTRRYNGPQNPPLPTFKSELYKSSVLGTATLMPGFVRPTPGTSIGDLASCYFPSAVLANQKIALTGRYLSGTYHLEWSVEPSPEIIYFQVQRSEDGVNFKTIANVQKNSGERYQYEEQLTDAAANLQYRIAEVRTNGLRLYSNIINLTGAGISFMKKINPNPFYRSIEFSVQLRTAGIINVLLRDQEGRTVISQQRNGSVGENNIKLGDLAALKPGVYFIEVAYGNEVLRQKLIKQ